MRCRRRAKIFCHCCSEHGLDVVCIGKIASIYDSTGVTQDLTAKNNEQSIDQTIRALRDNTRGLIFSNLVDFDMLYGHRRDTEGYARALEHFDSRWPEIEAAMNEGDLVIITADHGNDPTYPGTDHTREYAPLIVFGKSARGGVNLGTRSSLSDIGQTIAENFLSPAGIESYFLTVQARVSHNWQTRIRTHQNNIGNFLFFFFFYVLLN